MLRNYLVSAWRNLWRYRLYSIINVGGLAAAYVVTIMVGLFLHGQLTWDRFHAGGERIYQVYVIWRQAEDRQALRNSYRWTPGALGAEMVATVPGVLRSLRLEEEDEALLSCEDRVFEEQGLHADPGFFEFFTFPLIAGDPGTALAAPGSIVVTRRLARRLFGDEDPMGRSVQLGWQGDGGDFVVTGVAADVPYASSLRFDWVIPFVHHQDRIDRLHGEDASPWATAGQTFLEIADAEGVEAALAFDLDRYMETDEHGDDLALVPLFDKRLHHDLSRGGMTLSYSYAFVAFLVLLLACINFANLAAGMSLTRAREVGVRKVIGATRGQVMGQYLAESVLISLGALALAVPLTETLLPGLNRLGTWGQVYLQLEMRYTSGMLAALAGLAVVMGLVAGAYPALMQSRMQPLQILRDRLQARSRSGRVLVVVQFAASTVFLTTALVVGRQVDHWSSMDQGFDPGSVLCIPTLAQSSADGVHPSRRFLEIFRREALPLPGVLGVSGSTDFVSGHGSFHLEGKEGPWIAQIEVDPGFVRTLGLELIEGEDFPPDAVAGGGLALVNQGLADQLEGQVIGTELVGERGQQPRIIGVVSNFEHKSYVPASYPTVITVRPHRPLETVLVRVGSADLPGTLAGLREAWDRLAPGTTPFSYRFLEDHIAERYRHKAVLASRLRWLGGFLALISCLGVFGMASLAVSKRTKEVGIRKVHGASVASVVWLLSSQSTRLVLLAVVIALPVAYQLSESFLAEEVNRIDLDLLSYLAGGLVALGLAWLVAGYHALRAALMNPVDSLCDE